MVILSHNWPCSWVKGCYHTADLKAKLDMNLPIKLNLLYFFTFICSCLIEMFLCMFIYFLFMLQLYMGCIHIKGVTIHNFLYNVFADLNLSFFHRLYLYISMFLWFTALYFFSISAPVCFNSPTNIHSIVCVSVLQSPLLHHSPNISFTLMLLHIFTQPCLFSVQVFNYFHLHTSLHNFCILSSSL